MSAAPFVTTNPAAPATFGKTAERPGSDPSARGIPPADTACAVVIRFRSGEKGTSATRGKDRSSAPFESPAPAAAARRAISVGSPSGVDPPAAGGTASLQRAHAAARSAWGDGRSGAGASAVKTIRLPAEWISETSIRFRVSVPVLSEQMTVTEPSVSTAGSFRIRARRASIRCEPRARVTVTTAGSPSGIAATARLTAERNSSTGSSPRNSPIPKRRATIASASSARFLPRSAIRRWSGVASRRTSESIRAIRPSSVSRPVPVATAVARPWTTVVPR